MNTSSLTILIILALTGCQLKEKSPRDRVVEKSAEEKACQEKNSDKFSWNPSNSTCESTLVDPSELTWSTAPDSLIECAQEYGDWSYCRLASIPTVLLAETYPEEETFSITYTLSCDPRTGSSGISIQAGGESERLDMAVNKTITVRGLGPVTAIMEADSAIAEGFHNELCVFTVSEITELQ
jgi:hypothetical protein